MQTLNERKLAQELGLSYWTVRKMRLEEGLPHFTVGQRIYYRWDTVDSWLSAKEAESSAPNGSELPDDEPHYGQLRKIQLHPKAKSGNQLHLEKEGA